MNHSSDFQEEPHRHIAPLGSFNYLFDLTFVPAEI